MYHVETHFGSLFYLWQIDVYLKVRRSHYETIVRSTLSGCDRTVERIHNISYGGCGDGRLYGGVCYRGQ